MVAIRHIRIENYRGIKYLDWFPMPGINCLIGPGDSGKTTVLDAIELCLNPRRYVAFGEAEYHALNYNVPILIEITIAGLNADLLDLERYPNFLRGFNPVERRIEDEPSLALEHALTIRVEGGDDLTPRWRLFSTRAESRGEIRDLAARDRNRLAPTRLGAYADNHLSWGQRSVLHRLAEQKPEAGNALGQARSAAKRAFQEKTGQIFDEALKAVNDVASDFAVGIGSGAKALLDTQQVSIGNAAIALHSGEDVPLRSMGLGSSRLLVAGLQRRAASDAHIALIDEIEHGLEPYRIARLLNVLGSKESAPIQIFLTTHSPVVLRELSSTQIIVLRSPTNPAQVHRAIEVGASETRQKTLRACAEAFLTPGVLVCEGKTEIGLLRGLDLFSHERRTRPTMARCGVYAADGGGAEAVARALAFVELGYRTAILRDNDVVLTPAQLASVTKAGIRIFQWKDDQTFEVALFRSCPTAAIHALLDIAIEARTEDSVEADIRATFKGDYSLERCRAEADSNPEVREVLAAASTRKDKKGNPKNWYKLIEPAERIGHEILPSYWRQFDQAFITVLLGVRQWIEYVPGPADNNS